MANLNISALALAPVRPLSADFARQQATKQIGNNYHSSSLSMLMPYTVNKTSLHPGGVLYVELSEAQDGTVIPACLIADCRISAGHNGITLR